MKIVIVLVFILSVATVSPGFCACECEIDPQVQRWVKENNHAAMNVVQGWVHGVPLKELVKDSAVILSNRIYILSKCKDNGRFLKQSLLLGSGTESFGLEILPSVIIEKMTGTDFFSPVPLFENKD